MNTELLIFFLISLIILIPIIYFLPIKLSKKGKMTLIAVSFLIAAAGLLTKAYMQLWQSILLLTGLVLLLSMILTKKFSPMLYSMTNGSTPESAEDKFEIDKEALNFTNMESATAIPVMSEIDEIKDESVELEEPADIANVNESDKDDRIEELEDIQVFEKDENNEDNAINPSEDLSASPLLASSSQLQEEEILPLQPIELEEIEELSSPAVENERESEEIPVEDHESYLSDIEELMFEVQAEAAAGAEIIDEVEAESDEEFPFNSDDADDIETLLASLQKDGDEETETFLREEKEEVELEEYPLLQEISEEELQVAADEEMEESAEEEPPVEVVSTNVLEDVQTVDHEETTDWNHPIYEQINDVLEHNVLQNEEQWNQMETDEETHGVVQEADALLAEQPASAEEMSKEPDHREVFETLLLQAEIAKKMNDKEQLRQIVESFLNYEKSDDERFNMLKSLLKDYINITK